MPAETCTGQRLAALLLVMVSAAALAQNTPAPTATETQQMIEALKPARVRNLLVRQTPPAASAAATPAPVVAPMVAAPAAPPPVAVPAPAPAPMPAPVAVATPAPAPPAAAPTAPAASPIAAPVAAPTQPSLSLAIQFESNSARVRPESGAVLGNLVAALMSPDLKSNRFVIEGHTDARGSAAANLKLSQERADEVRLYLVALGVNPARLRAVGKGASQGASGGEPVAAQNRRVRVVTVE